MTLVEIAKSTPRKRRPNRKLRWDARAVTEMTELGMLWARDGLSYGQCVAATGLQGGSLYSRLAWGLRQAVREGQLVDAKSARGWK